MGGFENRSIVGYDNTEELMGLIRPYTNVVRKQDANDLPDKVYITRRVAASKEQHRVYSDLKTMMATEYQGTGLKVRTILERMTRYQQVSGGLFPYKNADDEWTYMPMKGTIPKIQEVLDIVEDTDEKVIVWCRFLGEIELVKNSLIEVYGHRAVVEYSGRVDSIDRGRHIQRMQHDPETRFMVANQVTAGMGITVTAATISIYYSNSFSYEDRIQSEDRNHRTGQTNKVTYFDLVSDLPIDNHIAKALAAKLSMATYVTNSMLDQPAE